MTDLKWLLCGLIRAYSGIVGQKHALNYVSKKKNTRWRFSSKLDFYINRIWLSLYIWYFLYTGWWIQVVECSVKSYFKACILKSSLIFFVIFLVSFIALFSGEGKKGSGKRRLRLTLTGVHISLFDSYKCFKYHLTISLGSEFEVQSFKYSTYRSPYPVKGNVQFMNPISLSWPSPEWVWFGPCSTSQQRSLITFSVSTTMDIQKRNHVTGTICKA